MELGRVLAHLGGDQVVRDHVLKQPEPEERELREDRALVRDAGGQHHVEGADAVGGDDQEAVAEVVDVPHLAPTPDQAGPRSGFPAAEQRVRRLPRGGRVNEGSALHPRRESDGGRGGYRKGRAAQEGNGNWKVAAVSARPAARGNQTTSPWSAEKGHVGHAVQEVCRNPGRALFLKREPRHLGLDLAAVRGGEELEDRLRSAPQPHTRVDRRPPPIQSGTRSKLDAPAPDLEAHGAAKASRATSAPEARILTAPSMSLPRTPLSSAFISKAPVIDSRAASPKEARPEAPLTFWASSRRGPR